jgi:hypothetical protein
MAATSSSSARARAGVLGGATTASRRTGRARCCGRRATTACWCRERRLRRVRSHPGASYPDDLERAIDLPLIQMLWDRGESNAYLQHLTTDPYPTRRRTTSSTSRPSAITGRQHRDRDRRAHDRRSRPAAALSPVARRRRAVLRPRAVPSYPYSGSALVVWDFGSPAPPDVNLPPREGERTRTARRPTCPRSWSSVRVPAAGRRLVDVCNGSPCVTLEIEPRDRPASSAVVPASLREEGIQ